MIFVKDKLLLSRETWKNVNVLVKHHWDQCQSQANDLQIGYQSRSDKATSEVKLNCMGILRFSLLKYSPDTSTFCDAVATTAVAKGEKKKTKTYRVKKNIWCLSVSQSSKLRYLMSNSQTTQKPNKLSIHKSQLASQQTSLYRRVIHSGS